MNQRISSLSVTNSGLKTVFSKAKVIRYVEKDCLAAIQALFSSGLIECLVNQALVPATSLVYDEKTDQYHIEQDRIEPASYPYEWSPEMLRSAGLVVLKVNSLANKFGFELIDSHPFNVVFRYSSPLFVDIGSFARRSSDSWRAEEEFVESYINPLKLIKHGHVNLFRHIFLISGTCCGREISHITSSFGRTFPLWIYKALRTLKYLYKNSAQVSHDSALIPKHPDWLSKAVLGIVRSSFLPGRSTQTRYLERRLASIKLQVNSTWGNYHDGSQLINAEDEVNPSQRYQAAIDIINRLDVRSAIELAGNQGALSEALLGSTKLTKVICTDYDPVAVDKMHYRSRNKGLNMSYCCFDFMCDARELLYPERAIRLRCSLVIALAVTHHLVLTQNYDINRVLDQILMYTDEYVMIEFMPLGLWNGQHAKPVPSWYNRTWFEHALMKKCDLLESHDLEKNRILYVAKRS